MEDRVKKYDFIISILCLGDMSVGKTCLIQRYTQDIFSSSNLCTVGVDFAIKYVDFQDKRVKIQIYDTSG